MHARAQAATQHAARYMTQLAKHWGHKYEVTYDDTQARIVLPIGICAMTAGPDGLGVDVEAADAEALARIERVVAEHLGRFSFREPDLALAWVRD
jgi:hypothetical protein